MYRMIMSFALLITAVMVVLTVGRDAVKNSIQYQTAIQYTLIAASAMFASTLFGCKDLQENDFFLSVWPLATGVYLVGQFLLVMWAIPADTMPVAMIVLFVGGGFWGVIMCGAGMESASWELTKWKIRNNWY